MSLQVWLPLVRDLNNQGLADITVTNSGATLDSNGKLGGCYYFNGSSYIQISMPPIMTSIKNSTVCAWVKSTGSVVALGGISNDGNSTNAMVTLYTSGWQFAGGSAYKYISGGSIANSGVWHHVCCTVSDTTITTYLDGTQVATNTLTGLGVGVTDITSANFIEIGCDHPGGNEFLTGYVNDFRIYNHALSAKEVKELSKGLVAHYTLGDIGGCPNLLPYSKVSTANKNLLKTNILSNWNNLSITTIDGFDAYLYPTAQSSTWFSTGYWYKNMTANTTYTYSAYIYQDSSSSYSFNFTSLGHFQVYNSSSTASDKSHEDVVSARVYSPATIPPKTWTKISITFTTNTLAGSNFQVYPRYNIGANTFNLYFRDCKLELGNKATPWIPNSSDAEYTTMGYSDTTVYDSSGYNYHGTSEGTITVDSNTPRYSVSTKFAASSGSFSHPNITLSQFTFSFWAKHTVANRMLMGSNASLTSSNAIWYWYGDNSFKYAGGEYYYQHNAGSAESLLGTWIHFVATYDGTNITVYRNGVNEGSKAVTGDKTLEYLSIGNGYTSSYWAGGWVSDFRLYATCLSADDVKALYQVGASIDKDGNMFAYEYIEN
jgi:hypothetical protein